jgi:multisubunit Na+/H+ antiporter MnhB subunit
MKKVIAWATLIILAVALFYSAFMIPFGSPFAYDMDEYFITHGQEQTATNNIVTSIVFDYRGFDTLGEASVLITAVIGVGVLLRLRKKEEDYEYE